MNFLVTIHVKGKSNVVVRYYVWKPRFWFEDLVTKWEGIRYPILPDLHRSSYIENGKAYYNVNACTCMLCKQINFNCSCCYYVGCNMMFML